nr:MFS transporter [Methylonatrum kenyense]
MSRAIAELRPLLPTLLLLWGLGVYLRLTLMAAAPLAPLIRAELGLGESATGALTTLPLLMLAAAAMAGSFIVARLGVRNTAWLALFVLAAASAARGLSPNLLWLLTATAVMGLGIAVLQPTLPAMVREHCAGRIALATAIYTNGMLVGEVIGAGLTLPLVIPLSGGNWRLAVALWSLPAVPLLLVLLRRREQADRTATVTRHIRQWMPRWREPLLWRLGLLMGATAGLFFGTNAYMASILEARGEGDLLAGGLLLFNTAQVVASVLVLAFAWRLALRSGPIIVMMATASLALIPFLAASGWTALWFGFLVSLASGVQLILLLSLPPALAQRGETAAMAAGMFTIGYGVCFVVPLLGGALADSLGEPRLALVPVLVFGLMMCLQPGRLATDIHTALQIRNQLHG